MPSLSIKPCSWPGCGTLVLRGRCERHAYPDRSGPRNPKYASRYWLDLRAAQLRAHPLCEEHLARDEVAPATDVHHRDGDAANDAPENLASLCHACHSRHTATHDGGFGNRSTETAR